MTKPRPKPSIAERKRRALQADSEPSAPLTLAAADIQKIRQIIREELGLLRGAFVDRS